MMGVAPNVPTWFWSNPDFDFFHDLSSFVNQVSDTENPPYVFSIAYSEYTEEAADKYKDRLNSEFQKLGLRGLTLIFSSGNKGTGCSYW